MKLAKPDIIEQKSFTQIVKLIQQSKQNAFSSVNKELIDLYWNIGKHIGKKIDSDGWGKGTVEKLARYIQKEMIGSRGFSPQNLWRMSQFYEVYSPFPKLSSLLRELEKPNDNQMNEVFKDNLIVQVKLTNYLNKPLKRLTKRQFPILDGINPVENGRQKIIINRFNGFYSLVTNLSNSIFKYYRLVY